MLVKLVSAMRYFQRLVHSWEVTMKWLSLYDCMRKTNVILYTAQPIIIYFQMQSNALNKHELLICWGTSETLGQNMNVLYCISRRRSIFSADNPLIIYSVWMNACALGERCLNWHQIMSVETSSVIRGLASVGCSWISSANIITILQWLVSYVQLFMSAFKAHRVNSTTVMQSG